MVEIVQKIKKGSIGVIPTDTIYGLVGSALSKKAVERIYRVRGRDRKKPFIVLIGSFVDLKRFGVKLNPRTRLLLRILWEGPATRRGSPRRNSGQAGQVSVILPCKKNRFLYLHRGTKTLAFRLPKDKWLVRVLKRTGPLVAPSANVQHKQPAYTIREAKRYFGDRVDFYFDQGPKRGEPSSVIEIKR